MVPFPLPSFEPLLESDKILLEPFYFFAEEGQPKLVEGVLPDCSCQNFLDDESDLCLQFETCSEGFFIAPRDIDIILTRHNFICLL